VVKRTRAAEKQRKSSAPVLRFRIIGIAVMVVCAAILLPLFSVWKQVYLRETSIRKEILSDSLSHCQEELTRLTLVEQKLSSVDRIEKIAREKLGLDYAHSEQIEIISLAEVKPRFSFAELPLVMTLKKSIKGNGADDADR